MRMHSHLSKRPRQGKNSSILADSGLSGKIKAEIKTETVPHVPQFVIPDVSSPVKDEASTPSPASGPVKKKRRTPYVVRMDFSPVEKQIVEIKRTARSQKLMWTPQLHLFFLDALSELGMSAVPKQVHLKMNVEGLTRENVASHLQKFRQRMRRKKFTTEEVQRTIAEERAKALLAIQTGCELFPFADNESEASPELSESSPTSYSPSPFDYSAPQSVTIPILNPVEVEDSLFNHTNGSEDFYGERTYAYKQSVDDLSTRLDLQEATQKYYSNQYNVPSSNYIRDAEYDQLFPDVCEQDDIPQEQPYNLSYPGHHQTLQTLMSSLAPSTFSYYPAPPPPPATTNDALPYLMSDWTTSNGMFTF